MAQDILPTSVRLTSRWLNCCSEGAVGSGSSPRAVLLNDSVYMIGSRSNNNENIWKYSILKNTLMPISYPPNTQTVSADQHTITSYQSQLLWIGKGDTDNSILVLFALADEQINYSWKQIMLKSKEILPQMTLPTSISSTSEDEYLIVVVREPQLLSVLIFDGQEWRRRDGPDCTAPTHGRIDIIINNGTIFLTTYMGFYTISLKAILATSDALGQWVTLTKIPKETYSNMTSFYNYTVVLTRKYYSDSCVCVLAYEYVSDTWIILEELECCISWMIPTIMGLPDGRLLIFGVVPDPQQIPQFNVLQVTIKGIHKTTCMYWYSKSL